MKRITLCDWKVGFKKVSLTLLLHNKAGYSLAEAKRITDAVLNHEPVTIELPADDIEVLLAELRAIGVKFIEDNI